MRFNPCAHAVDWIRYPYTTRARVFRNTDTAEEISWFPVAEDAPALPFSSLVCNSAFKWWGEQWANNKGEIPDDPRPFNGRKAIPGVTPGHICGTREDHEQGGLEDGTLPPIGYGSSGLPDCCGGPVLPDAGGAGGGRAAVTFPFGPNTCPTAFQVQYGVDYTTGDLGLGEEWFQFPPDAHGSYALTFNASGGAFKTIEGFQPPCGSSTGFTIAFIIADGPGGTNFTNFFASGLLMRMFLSSGPTVGQFLTFRLDPF